MSISPNASIAVAISMLVTGALGVAKPAAPITARPAALCDAVVTDTLVAGQRSIAVVAKLGQDIGPSVSATFPAESNVMVADAKAGAEPKTVELRINAASALPGDWKLTVKGNLGACTGLVTVVKR